MASAAVLATITLIGGVILLLLTIYLVQKYSSEDVPLYVKVISVFGWYLGFAIILIVPLDIYIAQTTNATNPYLVMWWYLTYWSTFFLNMLLFPYMRSYLEAGEFTVKGKLIRSLKNELPFYVLYIVIIGATIGVLMSYKKGREALEKQGVAGTLMTLNMVVGLFSIILVLGYGIAAMPKYIFSKGSHKYQLDRQLFNLANTESAMILQDSHTRNLIGQVDSMRVPTHLHEFHLVVKRICQKF